LDKQFVATDRLSNLLSRTWIADVLFSRGFWMYQPDPWGFKWL